MIQELNTDTDTQLFAQMTVDQTKDLIKVLQEKVAYIEKMK